MIPFEDWLTDTFSLPGTERLSITLSYAQSLDGCLTSRRGQPTPISGPEAMLFTHWLRSAHQAILIGIGTLLSDNPRLSVRLVPGVSPRPVVLDSNLRIPLGCHLMQREENLPWIFCRQNADESKKNSLELLGAKVIGCDEAYDGMLNLRTVCSEIFRLGIRHMMVEGGARVVTRFLSEGLIDQAVITVAPIWLGGLNVIDEKLFNPSMSVKMNDPGYLVKGNDLIVYGTVGERIS